MATPKLEKAARYYTSPQMQRALGLSRFQLAVRIRRGILPEPTHIDPDSGIRFFDEEWLEKAKEILSNLPTEVTGG